jgi:hypothetical protein
MESKPVITEQVNDLIGGGATRAQKAGEVSNGQVY